MRKTDIRDRIMFECRAIILMRCRENIEEGTNYRYLYAYLGLLKVRSVYIGEISWRSERKG